MRSESNEKRKEEFLPENLCHPTILKKLQLHVEDRPHGYSKEN